MIYFMCNYIFFNNIINYIRLCNKFVHIINNEIVFFTDEIILKVIFLLKNYMKWLIFQYIIYDSWQKIFDRVLKYWNLSYIRIQLKSLILVLNFLYILNNCDNILYLKNFSVFSVFLKIFSNQTHESLIGNFLSGI